MHFLPSLGSKVPIVIDGFDNLIGSLLFNHLPIAAAARLVYSRNSNKSRLAPEGAPEELVENEISILPLVSKF